MRGIRSVVVVVAAILVAGAAWAQEGVTPLEKGVKTKGLVTSLGGFRGTANIPIVLTGQVVEIEPGGQTGRQRHLVPSYIYVLQGVLTTYSEGGPVGVAGIQYHTEGQSYMDAVGVWHNHRNTTDKPVRYLLLLIGTPGGPTTQKATAED